jgi:hypothetical protein
LLPSLSVGFALQDDKMAVHCVSQDLGPVDAEGIGPVLDGGRIVVGHTKAEHRHTVENTAYDKATSARFIPRSGRRTAHQRNGDDEAIAGDRRVPALRRNGIVSWTAAR